MACCLGVACAPTEDTARKFDITTSHADTDGKGETSTVNETDGGVTLTNTGASRDTSTHDAVSDETSTRSAVSNVTLSDDESDSRDTTDDASDDTSNDTSVDPTNDGSAEGSDGGRDDTTDDTTNDTAEEVSTGSVTSTDTSEDTSADTSEDTSADTSEDTSADTSEVSTDDTSDDGDPGLTSAIADFVWVTGGVGTGPGLFDDARFLAADQAGNVYVAEYEGDGPTRVQVFDTDGEFVTQWLTEGSSIVEAMAGTLSGHLFILQGGAVEHYVGATGEYLGRVAIEGSVNAIAVGPDAGLVVVSSDRILSLSPEGNVESENDAISETVLGSSIFINGATVDGSGNVFVIDTFETAVFKFSATGSFVDQLGVVGEGPGFLEAAPDAITTDRYGRIYIADWDGIEVLEPGGGYAGFIDLTGAIFGMATTIDDELYVLERNYGQLYKLKLSE